MTPTIPHGDSWLICRRKPRCAAAIDREQIRYEAMQAKASAIRLAHAGGDDARATEARGLLLEVCRILEGVAAA